MHRPRIGVNSNSLVPLGSMLQPKRAATDEVAVMIDSRDPLNVEESAREAELAAYADSWKA